ncbi:isochorismatase [Caballeronia sp. HLA56]
MAIPKIASYPMPTDMPTNGVMWLFDPKRAALLVHDLQDYFLDFYDRHASPVPQLLAGVGRLIAFARATEMPIYYTAQPANTAPADRALLTDLWGPGLAAQPARAAIAATVAPVPGDTVLDKWRYSAFQRSDLEARLRVQHRDQLAICGVYAHIGCLMTACDAFMRDIKPFLVGDAIADFSEREHRMALEYVSGRCGRVVSTDSLVGAARVESKAPSLGEVTKLVAESLCVPAVELRADADLIACGVDSIRMMAFVEHWRSEGYPITFVQLAEIPTLDAWTRLLQRAKKAST